MRAAILAASGLMLAAAVVVAREAQAQAQDAGEAPEAGADWLASADSVLTDAADAVAETLGGILPAGWGFEMWSESKIPAQYLDAIRQAEAQSGLPRNMLARLLWQECRYREDIITGRVKSPAGALGIAQFMPATAAEMGIDPLDPFAAIPAAAKYLRRLYDALGTWSEALAAYNWGIGNVRRKGIAAAPRETRNYYTTILADIGQGTVIA